MVLAQTSDQLTGLLLERRYLLAAPLAQGGLCAVYHGEDRVLRRPVVVKAVPAGFGDAYRAALRATALLAHPAVIVTYDVAEHDGRLFLVQEAVLQEGIFAHPLDHYFAAGLPVGRAVALGGQLARALAYANAQGIVHGDLSPAAVLVDRQALLHINNFGLPRDAEYFDHIARRIASSMGGGTDPAEHEGQGASAPDAGALAAPTAGMPPADAAGDVWSIGALVWQLLAPPAPADLPADLAADLAAAEAPPRTQAFREEVPDAVRAVVLRCIRPDHPQPIATAESLALELAELEAQLASAHPHAAPTTPPALRAAHDAVADFAAWAKEHEKSGREESGRRPWREMEPAAAPLFDAEADPLAADLAATQPTAEVVASAIRPRLSLPSRPARDSARGSFRGSSRAGTWWPSASTWGPRLGSAGPAQSDAGGVAGGGVAEDGVAGGGAGGVIGEAGRMGWLALAVLGGALFLIFFLIGFLVLPLLGR